MHYVYLLQSENDPARRYVGFTDDLNQQLAEHHAGHSKFTREHRPWRVVAFAAFASRDRALRFERYLKAGSGHAFAHRYFWS